MRSIPLFLLIIFTSQLDVRSEAINPLKNPALCGISTCDIDTDEAKFRYQPNVVYKYLYESAFNSLFEGTDNNDPASELHVSAHVELSFPQKCQGYLKVKSTHLKHRNVTIHSEPIKADYVYDDQDEESVTEEPVNDTVDAKDILHAKSEIFKKDIDDTYIWFDFRDGLIQEICHDTEEQVWVTNFKRGILSALQNTMVRLDLDHKATEADVSGKCEVSYEFIGGFNSSIKIKKTKHISTCQNRNKFKSIVQTTPYEFGKKGISWWPIYDSTSFCEVTIDNYIYTNIECSETNVLIPFSNEQHGAVSKSFTRLKLLSEANITDSNDVYIETRKSLIYDHSFSPKPVKHDIVLSRDYLKQMCALGSPNIQRDFPDKYVKFLSASRQLSARGLNQLLVRAAGICKSGRKHVLESLPYIGSSASIDLMKDLIMGKIKAKEMTSEVTEAWMLSMFYLPRPDKKVIESMFSLMQYYETKQNPMFILIPTSVAHTYCRNKAECMEDIQVVNVVKYLERIVVENLPKDLNERKTYEKLLVAMKGLGNIGVVSKSLRSDLQDIIVDESYTDDVKIQAIQMFRKTQCDQTRDYFLDIYQNFTQSVEVRIASYLQLMKCPTYLTIKDIKAFLPTERVNQVGSFVYSHLMNMAKTSSPQQIELQALLVDNEIDEKFKMDFRKFSKNYEYSLFFEEYNFGLTGESNLIFGVESYLPRSFSFNGTVNLFGGSVNPFEFNIRMQGMEHYVESIIGLDGPLNFERIIEKFRFIYDKLKSYIDIDTDIIRALIRSRRSTESTLIDGFPYKPKYDFDKPMGYFEQKVYGNDINFYHFEGLDQLSDIIKKLVPLERVKNIFSKNKEVFKDTGTIVDISYTIPSSTGFPVILYAFGAYSLDISYYAGINNKNIWETKSLDFTGKLMPSLSIELNTAMQMDLFHATTEIKFKSNVYSNYALETDVVIKGNEKASMKIKVPQDRNDIFSIRTQLLSRIQDKEVMLYGITSRTQNNSCSWPTIDETLGLKLCIDYSLPDVSDQSKIYPSLILSGPIRFDIHLDKADMSAKVFTFDYNLEKSTSGLEASVVFETPNSKIPRKLHANLITGKTDYNFTMNVINGEKVQKTLGLVKYSPDVKSIDFSISQNDKKTLSLEMSMVKKIVTKTKSRTVTNFLLTIRDERLAGMNGIINTLEKSGIVQHDYDLHCETKNLRSDITGTLLLTASSVTLDTQFAYKFVGQKQQTIDITTVLANRSQRLTEFTSSFKFVSTAHPKYNFISNGTFISSMGHAEVKVDFNNGPELNNPAHTLTTKISLAKNNEDSKNSETIFFIEVQRPLGNIDVKFFVKYLERYKNGTEYNVLTTLKYSPDKEASMKASVFLPKGNLFGVDSTFLVTFPEMGSCSANVRIKERMRKDYLIDISGEWFSKENIKFVGTYQDRTSNVKRFYRMKSIISSNMFEDINLLMRYSRDIRELKVDVKTDYKAKIYSFSIESIQTEPYESIFKTEVDWGDHMYSIIANSSSKDLGKIKVEIHLDRIRDMHLEAWGIAKTFSRKAGIEFKWDANRDPTQKFIFSYNVDQPRQKFFTGNVLVSYPDRTVNGKIQISNEGPYTGEMKISWSASELIDASYSFGSDFSDSKKLWMIFKVDTPFAEWKSNRINGSIVQKNNLLSVDFATVWAESQSIAFDFFIDYLLSEKELSCDLRGSIQSTIKDIPIVFSHFKYNQTVDELESDVLFKHKNFITGDEFRTFSMKSLWKKTYDEIYRNISGTIKFISPIENYKSGALITKFSTTKDRELYGVIDMDIDKRIYSFSIEGYLRRILDNMISFNISTPIETFPSLLGKFGVVEHKKYLIADLKTFNKSLGIEVLFDFKSITDFDLKFYAATPQAAFERILMIGKIKDNIIHLEGAWNKINLGFKRISHYAKYNDFEYSFLIFTPLANFEKNGLILRLITKDIQNFDIETSLKLGKYKIGLRGFGEPKKVLLNQLGLQKATYIREEYELVDELDSDEAEDETKIDIDLTRFYSLSGNFEVCTMIWKPITGDYEVQQIDDVYHADAKISTHKGLISVSNKFSLKSDFDFTNRLKINTPIIEYKAIASNLKLKFSSNDTFTARFDIGIQSKSQWRDYGFKLNYIFPKTIQYPKLHDVSMVILYPLMNTSKINIHSSFELTKTGIKQANFSLDGFRTHLSMSGVLDREERNINCEFNIALNSPVLEQYNFYSYLRKVSETKDNQVYAGFLMNDNGTTSRFDSELYYRIDPNHVIDGFLAINSNIFPIQKFNSSVFISESSKPVFHIHIQYSDAQESSDEIKFHISKKQDKFEGELIVTPLNDFSSMSFIGDLQSQAKPGAFKTKGKIFKDTQAYDFEGDITFNRNLPTQGNIAVKLPNEEDAAINYILEFDDMKRSINAKISQNARFVSFESELFVQNLIDWAYNIKILSSNENFNELKLSTALTPSTKSQFEASFEMITPWTSKLIDKVNVSSLVNLNPTDGDFSLVYEISKYSGNAGSAWKWIQKSSKQDYMLKVYTNSLNNDKSFITDFAYTNPAKSPADISFSIDINKIWTLNTKAKFHSIKDQSSKSQEFSILYDISLPKPVESSHKIEAKYRGSQFPPRFELNSHSDCFISYTSGAFSTSLNAKGKIETYSDMNNHLNLEWGQGNNKNKIGSDLEMSTVGDKNVCKWELTTPYNKAEKTLLLNMNYNTQDIFKIVHADVNYPESKKILIADVAFADMQNTKGTINTSLPVLNMTEFNVSFDFDSKDEEATKYIKATWPDNYALIDSKSTFIHVDNHKEWKGTIKAEIPLQTKHNIQIIYGLEEKPLITTGDASVEYNAKNVLNSHYTCKTEKMSENHVKDIIDLSLENELKPLGIHYVHEKRVIASENFDLSNKHFELFDLSKENRFNITGEFTVEIKGNDQKYKLIAIHPNRTIVWTSDYSSDDLLTYQSSKIELAEDIWLGYNFKLANNSKDDTEGQEIKFQIAYPSRNISVGGNYVLRSDSLDTGVNVEWNRKEEEGEEESKSLEGSFQWKDLTDGSSKNKQFVLLTLKHPEFKKDVTLQGVYFKDKVTLAKVEIDVDYSDDPDHHAKFFSEIKDLSKELGYKNITLKSFAEHVASELIFNLEGSIGVKPTHYQIEAVGNYKRGYLPNQDLELIGFVDVEKKELKIYRLTPTKEFHVYGLWKPNFPVYAAEGIYVDSPDYETNGNFDLNLKQKTIVIDVNLLPDSSQKFQVHGVIPDTRSAQLNIWRNYEDIRIDDISYFIQMNHSRLITSKLLWRPKLKKEIKNNLKNFMASRYNATSEELDYWVKTLYNEVKDIIVGIWDESRDDTRIFFQDLESIKDIDNDLSAFKNFLNQSYMADDFYIQSLLNYTLTVLEELAITDHIQTIPKIFKEMWEVLGESSLAFKNSIIWIVDMLKVSYKESLNTFNKLIHGNSMEYVTQFLNTIIENYDRFVRNLHITFMNYIETMWDNLVQTLAMYWNRILQNIEPQILRSIHYVESTLWSISSEVFDFMYNRTNELIDSPYFTKVSNITHDLDVLYQDVQHNDIFTNFKKYSGQVYTFIKEKILRIIPFGQELREIFGEAANFLKQIRTLDGIREYFDRIEEIVANFKWFMDEFQLEKRFNALIEIMRKKLMRITQNALQTEDVYREAKTRFIFDPNEGIIEWEQKLPMAWHAFNETPQFEEIPEYKLFNDVQTFLFGTENTSSFNYYGFLLNEPQNLMPPFNSYALLIGSRHVVTFDRSNLEFDSKQLGELVRNSQALSEQCSYLLAHDFIDERLTLLLKPSAVVLNNRKFLTKTLFIQSNGTRIEVELGNPSGELKIDDKVSSIFPISTGDFLITRELNIVTINSRKGFKIQCNLEFDVCYIELSGWYFGKVAGILGTMNNEQYDDFTTSDNFITTKIDDFIESWATKHTCNTPEIREKPTNVSEELVTYCEQFFHQKTSYLLNCFNVLDPLPFYEMCLNLGNQQRGQSDSKSIEKAACTSAIAYIEACSAQRVPLRIPDTCIYCVLPNGTHITEGHFVDLKDDAVKPSVDVVFIMDAKDCNVDATRKKMLSSFVTTLKVELKNQSIDDVRFAVVSFGGRNEFKKAEIITSNGKTFTDSNNVNLYFDHLKREDDTHADVFTAITKAAELIFRPGAVKIFVLSLCSECELNLLKFDFKSVSQLLRENDITLHILSNQVFSNSKVMGVDNTKAYSRKDQKKLLGDDKLRRSVKFPQSIEQCASLALETDGSIFLSGNRTNVNEYRIVGNIFAKRVAAVSLKPCHICECEGQNSGIAYLTCTSCENMIIPNYEDEFEGFDLDVDDYEESD